MSQKSPDAIERGTVPVEAGGKKHHDVSLLLALLTDVLVRHLLEDERRGLLPHAEGLADGLVRVVPAQLLRVVLDAGGTEQGLSQAQPTATLAQRVCSKPSARKSCRVLIAGYLKVRWLWLQRRPVSAYLFRRMLDFIWTPNWSGTPQRGRFIHLPGGHQVRAQRTTRRNYGHRSQRGELQAWQGDVGPMGGSTHTPTPLGAYAGRAQAS